MREDKVREVHARLNPEQVKGLRLTETERGALLDRLVVIETEIRNAAEYQGAL